MWKRFLVWLFNDWKDVEIYQGKWDLTVNTFMTTYNENKYVTYTIQYSKIIDKYRLYIKGWKPYEHPTYPKVLEHFNKKYTKLIE